MICFGIGASEIAFFMDRMGKNINENGEDGDAAELVGSSPMRLGNLFAKFCWVS